MSALMYYAGAGLGLGILMVSRPTLLFTKVSHSLSFFATKHRLFLHHEPSFGGEIVSRSPVCNVSHWPAVDFYVWAEVSLCVTDVHRTSPLPGGSWRSKSRVATSTQRPHWRYNHFQTGSRSPPPVQPKFLATSTLTL